MNLKAKFSGLFKRDGKEKSLRELMDFLSCRINKNKSENGCAFALASLDNTFSGCILGNNKQVAELLANACIQDSKVLDVVLFSMEMVKEYYKKQVDDGND